MKQQSKWLALACAMILGICSVLATPGIRPISVFAAEVTYTSGDLSYILLEDGTIQITHCDNDATGDDGNFTIPATIDGVDVTSIAAGVFSLCNAIRTVTIPSTVTHIDPKAFDGRLNLYSIYVNDANPVYCDDNGVLFDKNKHTLLRCISGHRSVYTIPDTVTEIGPYAFYASRALPEVVIPASVKTIGKDAFLSCGDLERITVDPDNTVFASVDGVLFNKQQTQLLCYPNGATAEHYTVPQGVQHLQDYSFYNNNQIRHVTLPDSVKIVGHYAFFACQFLSQVDFCEGVTWIGDSCFANCMNLAQIDLPDSVNTLGEGAFQGASALTEIVLPAGLTSVPEDAFRGCTALNRVVVPAGVTEIGNAAFMRCYYLEQIYLPASLDSIWPSSFNSCYSLADVHYGGTEEQWAALEETYGQYETLLFGATIHFAATPEDLVSMRSLGDLDGDGAITIQDAYQVLVGYANMAAGLTVTWIPAQWKAADVDDDGDITIQDAYKILCYYADGAAGLTPSWD